MVKNSKVKSVQANGTWKNKKGDTFFKYEIEMENGDSGEYSSISDSQDKFIEGNDVQYNYIGGEYPKIKPYYSNPTSYTYSSSNNSDDKEIARSVGIKAAVQLGIAQGLDLAEILETAKILSDFITNEKEVIKKEVETQDVPF
tara:strand:+ start:131 stop:559 length:429 start_codon:yes stop_codon:yes gene_type:complete